MRLSDQKGAKYVYEDTKIYEVRGHACAASVVCYASSDAGAGRY